MSVKHEHGLTLVEVLAAVTLTTICAVLIISVWVSAEQSASRTLSENNIQQDAQLVQKRAQEAYINRQNTPFMLQVNSNHQVVLVYGDGTSHVISGDGISYQVNNQSDGTYSWPSSESGDSGSSAGTNFFSGTNDGSSSLAQQPIDLTVSANNAGLGDWNYQLTVTLSDAVGTGN
ncbi:MAG: hypothetical protein ABF586_04660 [Sporolactobacillus sp.]